MENRDLQKNYNNQRGISALLLVISITTLTVVSAVVMTMINTTNTVANYQLTEKDKVQFNMESCINDAMWRINSVKQTEGSYNMDAVGVSCSYKIGSAVSGLKTVTTTASTTSSFGNWQKTVVLSVNVSSTPATINSYRDSTYYDIINSSAALCGDWTCSGSETCSNCSVDCGNCYCGNGTCAGSETASNCSSDCPAVCGDTNCTHTETCSTCSTDCGSCTPVCGNGVKETGEACDYTGSYYCSANAVYDGAVGCTPGYDFCDETCSFCDNICVD